MKRKANPAELLLINPKGRKPRKKRLSGKHRSRPRGKGGRFLKSVRHLGHPARASTFHAMGYARNPRRRRRNPSLLSRGFVSTLGGGAVGALGGVALDLAMKPLPIGLKVGPINHLVRGVGAVALGLLASLVKIPGAADVAKGALAITVYNAARQYVTVPYGLGEMSDGDIADLAAAGYAQNYEGQPGDSSMGEFMPGVPTTSGALAEYLGDLARSGHGGRGAGLRGFAQVPVPALDYFSDADLSGFDGDYS